MSEIIPPIWEYLLRLRHVTVEELAIAVLPEKASKQTIALSEIQALHEAVYQSDNDDQWHKAILIYESLTRYKFNNGWRLISIESPFGDEFRLEKNNYKKTNYDIVEIVTYLVNHTGNRDLIPQPVIEILTKIINAESEQQTEPDDKPNDSVLDDLQSWQSFKTKSEQAIAQYPEWSIGKRTIKKTGNLNDWLKDSIGCNTREAELIKNFLSDKFKI